MYRESEQRARFFRRLMGVSRLDTATLAEIKGDDRATGAAVGVIVLVAASGWFATGADIPTLPGYLVARLSWFIAGALLVYSLGTTVFMVRETDATWVQIFRTLGFAQFPAVVQALGIVPGMPGTVYITIFVVANLWRFAAMTAAVRYVLSFESNVRTIVMVGIAFVPWLAIEIFLQPA